MDTNLLRISVLALLFSFTINANAQYATNVVITDVGNAVLQNTMAENASKLITESDKLRAWLVKSISSFLK